jgi:hypothetical protein
VGSGSCELSEHETDSSLESTAVTWKRSATLASLINCLVCRPRHGIGTQVSGRNDHAWGGTLERRHSQNYQVHARCRHASGHSSILGGCRLQEHILCREPGGAIASGKARMRNISPLTPTQPIENTDRVSDGSLWLSKPPQRGGGCLVPYRLRRRGTGGWTQVLPAGALAIGGFG